MNHHKQYGEVSTGNLYGYVINNEIVAAFEIVKREKYFRIHCFYATNYSSKNGLWLKDGTYGLYAPFQETFKGTLRESKPIKIKALSKKEAAVYRL